MGFCGFTGLGFESAAKPSALNPTGFTGFPHEVLGILEGLVGFRVPVPGVEQCCREVVLFTLL